jgi:hydroxymethylglutaryl-CoA reductase (NADPH)
VAGPLLVDGKEFYLPMATTEGALVASTTRGCKALSVSGGVRTELVSDGMSRAPVLSVPSIKIAAEIKHFTETHFHLFQESFNSTSRFARLKSISCHIAGRKLFLRFKCTTGDAMGMNMVGKGVEHALSIITERWNDVSVISLSGNVCTDKKPSSINWLDGRGKSIVAEAIIKADVVRDVLKTTTEAIVECNYSKNLIGSAIAGSIGGFNAHAANVVAAMFLATGQDPAQVVESSNCMTLIERLSPDSDDLYISVTMPCLEVGAVGGGTQLAPQSSMLTLLGVKGSNAENPGANAAQLARVIASGVMAGELSLMAALSSGHLISSHMKLNRKHTTPQPAPSQ